MRTRKRGNSLQVYVSAYDPARKRGVERLAITHQYTLPSQVTDEDREAIREACGYLLPAEPDVAARKAESEIEAYETLIAEHAERMAATRQRMAADRIAEQMRDAATAIENGFEIDVEAAQAIFEAWGRVRYALKQNGLTAASVRPRKAKTHPLPGQTDAFGAE